MVQQSGKGESQKLFDIAKSTYNNIPLENRLALFKESDNGAADDIFLSHGNNALNSDHAYRVTKNQEGGVFSSNQTKEKDFTSGATDEDSNETTETTELLISGDDRD